MPTATVRLAERIADNIIDCAVRVDHQGFASVELCVDALGIFPKTEDAPTWRTLEAVLRTSDVRAVTFRGPWND